ncbi:MAG: BNR repeat-containing protein [Phycisphaerae bacterium]
MQMRNVAAIAAAVGGVQAMTMPNHAIATNLELTPTSNSVVDPSALLLTKSATYGRAINGQGFQDQTLITHDGYQYTTWWRYESGTNTNVQSSMMIARRTVDGATVGAWETVDTGTNLVSGLGSTHNGNAHNVISMGISAVDGRIHLSYDHHNSLLKYRRSAAGVATDNKAAWGPGMFAAQTSTLPNHNNSVGSITYPAFYAKPDGTMNFAFRSGGSGNGDMRWATYRADGTFNWPDTIITGGNATYTDPLGSSNSRNAYVHGFDYDASGRLHTTWVWREAPNDANHDISYAYSDDGGFTWFNGAGQQVADTDNNDPISFSDPGLVFKSLDRTSGLYNQVDQAVSQDGRVHTLDVHRRPGAEFAYQPGDRWDPLDSAYFHYTRDPATGDWAQHMLPRSTPDDPDMDLHIGHRGSLGVDADGNIFAVYTARDESVGNYKYANGALVVAGATAASNFTDWTILHLIDDVGFEGDPQIDDARLLNDGILSIFVQEKDPRSDEGEWSMTGSNLRVIEFQVVIPEPAAATTLLGLWALGLRRTRR